MSRYFWAANLWAIIALLLMVLRTPEPNSILCSVAHLGQCFRADEYSLMVLAAFAVSVVFLVMTWKTRGRQ
jgi:hypothetical protein